MLTLQSQLQHGLEARRRYADCLAVAESKLGGARAEIELLEADANPEHARDKLEQHEVRSRDVVITVVQSLIPLTGCEKHLETISKNYDLTASMVSLNSKKCVLNEC